MSGDTLAQGVRGGEGRKRGDGLRTTDREHPFFDSLDSLEASGKSGPATEIRPILRRDREQHPDLSAPETFEVLAELESGWNSSVDKQQSRFGPLEDVAVFQIQETLTASAQIFEEASRRRRETESRDAGERKAMQGGEDRPRPIQIERRLRTAARQNTEPAPSKQSDGTAHSHGESRPPGRSPTEQRREQAGTDAEVLMPSQSTLPGQLERLARLRGGGLLSDEEFAVAKHTVIHSAKAVNLSGWNQVPATGARGSAEGKQVSRLSAPSSADGGAYSLLAPGRNAIPAEALQLKLTPAQRAPMRLFDVNRSKEMQRWMRRERARLPLTAHVSGNGYDTRYKLHPFSGYEVATLEAPPAWSIPGKARTNWITPTSDTPGPGMYEVVAKVKARPALACVFGSEVQRPKTFDTFVEKVEVTKPGPGTYDLPPLPPDITYTFPKGEMRPLDAHSKNCVLVPGPGEYQAEPPRTVPCTVFGSEDQRPPEVCEVQGARQPGPGEYALPDEFNKEGVGAGIGFGDKTACPTSTELERMRYPGPGTYEQDNAWGAGGTSFPQEEQRPWDHQQKAILQTPGPGADYQPLSWETPGPQFGTAVRVGGGLEVMEWELAERAQVPGPGKYDPLLPTADEHAYSFGQEARMLLSAWQKEQGKHPAVGHYSPALIDTRIPITFGSGAARADDPMLLGPRLWAEVAPGAYLGLGSVGAQGTVFGREEQRPDRWNLDYHRTIPGAGKYATDRPGMGEGQGLGGRFGKEEQRPLEPQVKSDIDNPGAGDYQHQTSFPAPAYTFPKMEARPTPWWFIEGSEKPGPGCYDPRLDEGLGTVFGRVEQCPTWETVDVQRWNPGPGMYDPALPPGVEVAFTREQRELHPEAKRKRAEPGPGYYTIRKDLADGWDDLDGHPQSVGKEQRYGFPVVSSAVPGPGNYQPSHGLVKERAPTMLLGREAQRLPTVWEKAWAENPGAGRYTVEESAGTLQQGGARASKFPEQEQRPKKFEEEELKRVPGPGLYHKDRDFWAAAAAVEFTRAPMRALAPADQARRAVPGVGQYDVALAEEAVAAREPAVGFVKAEQRPLKFEFKELASVPGAGSYDSPPLPDGVAWTMGKEMQRVPTMEEKAKEGVPGVGAYDVEPSRGLMEETAPAWSMAKQIPSRAAQDSVGQTEGVPGPGEYEVEKKVADGGRFEGPSTGFTREGRKDDWLAGEARAEDVPGPGKYGGEYEWGAGGQGISFTREAQRAEEWKQVPGVGEYDLRGKVAEGGAVKGPDAVFDQERRVTMFIDERPPPTDRETPGAGTYDPEPGVTRTGVQRISGGEFGTEMQRKVIWHEPDADDPGPAHYQRSDAAPAHTAAAGHVFGNAAQRPQEGEEAWGRPGPGAYDVEGVVAEGGVVSQTGWTMAKRELDPSDLGWLPPGAREAPGPGMYEVEGVTRFGPQTAPGFAAVTAVQRPQGEGGLELVPGPGEYEVEGVRRTGADARVEVGYEGPGTVFGPAGGRGELFETYPAQPGPGQYDVRGRDRFGFQAEVTRAAGMGIGVKMEDGWEEEAARRPGPGSYWLPAMLSDNGVDFGAGGGRTEGAADETPGPGQYGPGAEELRGRVGREGPGVVFGAEAKAGPEWAEYQPGPGEYDVAGVGYLGGRFESRAIMIDFGSSAGARVVEERGGDQPGPGAYDVMGEGREAAAGQGVPFGVSTERWAEYDEWATVGPGEYEVARGFDATGQAKRVPGVALGSGGLRMPDLERDTPGPGRYAVEEHLAPPLLGTFGRADERGFSKLAETSALGPGAYALPVMVPSAEGEGAGKTMAGTRSVDGVQVARGVRSAGFGEGPATETPGPGRYDVAREGGGQGPALYMAERPLSRLVHRNAAVEAELAAYPGPGRYQTEHRDGSSTRVAKRDPARAAQGPTWRDPGEVGRGEAAWGQRPPARGGDGSELPRRHMRFMERYRAGRQEGPGAERGGGWSAAPEMEIIERADD